MLLILDRHRRRDWHLTRARELFDRAMASAWDGEHGGMVYGIDPDGRFYDEDTYFRVQAESLAAAALLAGRMHEAGDEAAAARCWHEYERLWAYSRAHFVDHQHGAWYRILSRDNRQYSDEKNPAGKVDHHTMGACYEALSVAR
ncbi:D-mannose isomerase [Caballeronia glathei]|nr:D-mannose isomerase [Caballeronia glathei]